MQTCSAIHTSPPLAVSYSLRRCLYFFLIIKSTIQYNGNMAAAFSDEEFERLCDGAPLAVFARWFADAKKSEPTNPEAVTLATATAAQPQARTVLLKAFGEDGFIFYTNRDSRKGQALRATPAAAMLFYWKSLSRQVAIEGAVRELSAEQTQAYFNTRPLGSRIAACASQQSRPLAALADFRAAVARLSQQYNDANPPPCPPAWRGFALHPNRMEFWCEGAMRQHQRAVFCKDANDQWTRGQLLYP